jgi:hypothetical protein
VGPRPVEREAMAGLAAYFGYGVSVDTGQGAVQR